MTQRSIIVAWPELPVITLAPLGVNYDQTVEEMIAENAPRSSSDIISEHFPRIPDKTGVVDESLYLVRPVSTGQVLPDDKVVEVVTAAGYSFKEWPSLGPLKPHADELWNAGIQSVAARGLGSLWPNPHGGSCYVIYFHIDLLSVERAFYLHRLASGWRGDDWFLCRKLPQPLDT